MTKIAVVDDNNVFADEVAEAILADFQKKEIPAEVEKFYGSRRLLGKLDEHQNYDVYFLDVEMEYATGVDVAKRIRVSDNSAIIIFLTSHEKYAIVGYSCQAFEYITKEKWRRRLPDILNQIQKRLKERDTRVYQIHTERKYEVIQWDDIYYLEKEGKNTVFYCRDNKIYQDRCPLAKVYEQLEENEFAYVNRGQIINLKYVTHLDAETVEVAGVTTLPLSRYLLSEVRKKLLGYWRVK